jgi:uncharacterized membrane protein
MQRNWKWGVLLGLVLVMGAAFAYAATIPPASSLYFTTIDYPATGVVMTHAFGINSRGDIVGSYVDSTGVEHGYVLLGGIGGTFVQLDYPRALGTRANGINASGDIVGYYYAPPGASGESMKGFLATPNGRGGFTFTTILFPHHQGAYLSRITDEGYIYGCYHDGDASASMHGFVRNPDGTFISLKVMDSMDNGANFDGSTIVGFYTDLGTNKEQGFIDTNGSFVNLDVPGSVWTDAWDISPDGSTVLGTFLAADNTLHGFLFANGTFSSIDDPNAGGFTQAFGINSSGAIVGFYRGTDGKHHGFLAQPN